MRRKLSALLCLLSLVGCGNLGTSSSQFNPGGQPRELMVIPNYQGNSLTIKELDLSTGESKLLAADVPSYGSHPVVVRSHPTLKFFYVVNRDSNVICQFSLSSAGEAQLRSSISCPPSTSLLLIHPSGGWAYAAGGGVLRTYRISSQGLLTVQGGDVLLAADPGWDGDFSSNGSILHLPETGRIQSFPLNQGNPGQPVETSLSSQKDQAVDLDVRPGGSCMLVAVQGNDSVRAYRVGRSGFPELATVNPLNFRPGTGDFSFNGQYYLGENASLSLHSYDCGPLSGLLTELSGSPSTPAGAGGSFFVGLDLSEDFLLTSDGSGNDRVDIRRRTIDGGLSEVRRDSQNLETPGKFDFVLFQSSQ